MSRFYQALKEASRLPERPNEPVADRLEASLRSSTIELPPVVESREARTPSEPAPDLDGKSAAISLEQELFNVTAPIENGHLGTVAKFALDQRARVLPQTIDASIVEYYRSLRTKILQQQTAKLFRSLLIASPNPQDGKTVTVLNLGFSFAMLPSYKVLVVDGDLRKGSLGKWLGVEESRPGFRDLLAGSAKLEDVVLRSDDNPLHFIVRGNADLPAAELLNSPELSSHFRRMAEHFDLILVDSPPVNLMTDAQLLASRCDAVLLVARAFATTRKAFEKAVQDLQAFRVIGAVLNGGTRTQGGKYYSYYGAGQ
jgi:capsular exopolysaccharide synthesis family protein